MAGTSRSSCGRVTLPPPQGLADVDVAKPRNHPLVEQQQLDRRLAAQRRGAQMRGAERVAERFGAERAEGGPALDLAVQHEVDRAETARIVQCEAVCSGFEDQVVVAILLLRVDPPAPAHAEVEHHHLPVFEMHQPVFRAPSETGHARAGQRLDQSFGEGAAQVRAVDRRAGDPLALEEAGKAAHGGFDFGKFGHVRGALTAFAPWANSPKAQSHE